MDLLVEGKGREGKGGVGLKFVPWYLIGYLV
jgi:hypothetical protein